MRAAPAFKATPVYSLTTFAEGEEGAALLVPGLWKASSESSWCHFQKGRPVGFLRCRQIGEGEGVA